MSEHHNAKTTALGRQLLVDRVLRDQWSVDETAEALGISAPPDDIHHHEREHESEEGRISELRRIERPELELAGKVVSPTRHDMPDIMGLVEVIQHPFDLAVRGT